MTRTELVAYPKSGRTWIRFALAKAGCDAAIRFHHDGFEFNDGSLPPHDFDIRKRMERYAPSDRVVYLERDPRDVMVSLFHQVTGRFRDFFGYTGTISQFIRHEYFGAENLHRFRSMWNEIAAEKGFLKVSYEECHRDMTVTLRRIVSYCELEATPQVLQRAIEAASFENMKAVEDSDAFPKPWLRKRNGASKVRRGVVGGHRQELGQSDIAYLDAVFGAATGGRDR